LKTSNQRIEKISPLLTPSELVEMYPVSSKAAKLITATREKLSSIIHKDDDRLLVIVGPCSIHDVDAAHEYADKLKVVRENLSDQLEIVMRVYFEKPRTTIGWKGLINDPDLDGSYQINKGLQIARKLLLEINMKGLPAGCEFLDALTAQYYADIVSWGAIGARTTESQIHRELASGLSCPIGFKNGTNGSVNIAADAVIAARSQHVFPGLTEEGGAALFTTKGNQDSHVILRGGKDPNYDAMSVANAVNELEKRSILAGLMIDMSHANSQKQYERQLIVGEDIAQQIEQGSKNIIGCMIESHLVAGNQKADSKQTLTYGQSITDACIDFEQTNGVLSRLAESVEKRRSLSV